MDAGKPCAIRGLTPPLFLGWGGGGQAVSLHGNSWCCKVAGSCPLSPGWLCRPSAAGHTCPGHLQLFLAKRSASPEQAALFPTHRQLEEESFGMPCIFGDGQKHLVLSWPHTERPEAQPARMLQLSLPVHGTCSSRFILPGAPWIPQVLGWFGLNPPERWDGEHGDGEGGRGHSAERGGRYLPMETSK